MYFKPHKIYKKVTLPTELDENNDPISTTDGEYIFLCEGFCHHVDIKTRAGFAGKGFDPKHYVNIDRRDDLSLTDEIEIRDKKTDEFYASGTICDIEHTSGMIGNYTIIYIE